jgi:hypothetical protein
MSLMKELAKQRDASEVTRRLHEVYDQEPSEAAPAFLKNRVSRFASGIMAIAHGGYT